MLREGVEYRDLGPQSLDRLEGTKVGGLVRRLQNLGYPVHIEEAAA